MKLKITLNEHHKREALDRDEVHSRIDSIFKKYNIHYDYFWDSNDGTVAVDVDNGDWRHDHIFLDNVMEDSGFVHVKTDQYGEDTGGDWYSAEHVYKPTEQVTDDVLKGFEGKSYDEVLPILGELGYDVDWIPSRIKRAQQRAGSSSDLFSVSRYVVTRGKEDLTLEIDTSKGIVVNAAVGFLP